MRKLKTIPMHLASLLLLHACSAGIAAPNLLVTRPATRNTEWLPNDNQTVYKLETGKIRRLELNTSGVCGHPVHITVSPCSQVHWAVYRGTAGEGHLKIVEEHVGSDVGIFSTIVSEYDRYVLQLSAPRGGAAAVSVRGERPKSSRLRLRVRSRRRLSAVWDPSPIDPHATSYCVVASHRKNYTSLCAAQYDIKVKYGITSSEEKPERRRYSAYRVRKADRFSEEKKERAYSSSERRVSSESSERNDSDGLEMDNKIDVEENTLGMYDENFRNIYRRKKYSRSTKISDQDPVIACVGDRTHHFIDSLDPSMSYFVSIFGVAQDRRAGTLLASNSVVPRTSVARRLKENVPFKTEIRGRMVFYYKTTISSGGGLWLAVTTCGGAVDVDVSVRGRRLQVSRNIADPHESIFIPAPGMTKDGSDESSIQVDSSSSEEARVRFVIKVTPSKRDRDSGVRLELQASPARSRVSPLSLTDPVVKELRPRRSCRSVDIAFLPAYTNSTDVIRYCTSTRESLQGEYSSCDERRTLSRVCVSHSQRSQTKVIIQKLTNLKPGHRYEARVIASTSYSSVPYKTLFVETYVSCDK